MKEGVKDEYKLLVKFIERVEKYCGDKEVVDEESLLNDLEEIQDVVAQIDMGNDFIKLGGGGAMLKVANDANSSPRLRSEALYCLGTAVQNNSPSQEKMIGCGAVEAILSLTKNDVAEEVKVAAMGAVGNVARGSSNGEKRLVSPESALVFREAVLTGGSRLLQKTVFLLKAIAMTAEEMHDSECLRCLGDVIEPVVSAIASESSDLAMREHAIGFIITFVTVDPSILDTVAGLRDSLKNAMAERTNLLRCTGNSDDGEQENARVEMDLWMQLNAACEGMGHESSRPSGSGLSEYSHSNGPLLMLAKP